MKYCQECGRMLRDADESCPYCGTYQDIIQTGAFDSFEPQGFEVNRNSVGVFETNSGGNSGSSFGGDYNSNFGGSYNSNLGSIPPGQGDVIWPIPKYSFAKFIILSILTCGIYAIYKKYKWTEDINKLCYGVGEASLNYLLVWVISMFTCGIYELYWTYTQTERLKETGYRNGVEVRDSGVQNLLLLLLTGLPGFFVVWYILFHNTNRLSAVYNGEQTREAVNVKSSHKGLIVLAIILSLVLTILSLVGTVLGITALEESETFESALEEEVPELFGFDSEAQEEAGEEEESDLSSLMLDDYKEAGSQVDFGEYTVEIKDATKMYDFDNNKAITIDFTWTNNSDEEASALWVFFIQATQGNRELETTWPSFDETEVSMTEYLENVEPGESLDFQVMFEVENDTDPVKVYVTLFQGESNLMAVKEFKIADQEA